MTGHRDVVLSGGYFLNCSNNYEYIKRFPDLRFFVDPIAHDGGTAIGAAKYLWHKLTGDTTVRRLETLYLG
jgi:carbamoyltransferase